MPKGRHPRWAQKLIFHIRIVKRNRNEIEAQKKSDFEHPTKTRKWKKMKENENERKWKKMRRQRKSKKNERKWRKEKKRQRKWKKMNENEKIKKWKKWENEKMKKNEKTWRKMMKKEEWTNWIHTQNPRRFPGVYRCCCNCFRQNPRRFPWFCFGMCLFPEENQQPVLGCSRFSRQFSLGVKQQIHILPTKIDETNR